MFTMASLHLLGHNDKNDVKNDFFSHVMQNASSMTPFCSLCEDSWNKVWHDSFGHIMLLAPVHVLHDPNGILNSPILFVRSRWLKQDAKWLFGSCDASGGINSITMTFSVIWHCWYWHEHNVMPMALPITPLYSLHQDNWNSVQHNFFGYLMLLVLMSVSHEANSVSNGAITFVRSRWWKWDAALLFWSCNAIGASISIMWCQWHYQFHHYICLVKIFEMGCDMTFWSCDATGTSFGITCCQWHSKWHNCIY